MVFLGTICDLALDVGGFVLDVGGFVLDLGDFAFLSLILVIFGKQKEIYTVLFDYKGF